MLTVNCIVLGEDSLTVKAYADRCVLVINTKGIPLASIHLDRPRLVLLIKALELLLPAEKPQ